MSRLRLRDCRHHGRTRFVRRTNGAWRCRRCAVVSVVRHRKQLKQKAVEHLGGRCFKCGYSRCLAALEFHHRDPSQKDFEIKGTISWARIVAELDKCDLLCANCHRETHVSFQTH